MQKPLRNTLPIPIVTGLMNRVIIIPSLLVIVDESFSILGFFLLSDNYLILFVAAILISHRVEGIIIHLPLDVLVKQVFHLRHSFFLSYWVTADH
jgi:hypothetical protein